MNHSNQIVIIDGCNSTQLQPNILLKKINLNRLSGQDTLIGMFTEKKEGTTHFSLATDNLSNFQCSQNAFGNIASMVRV